MDHTDILFWPHKDMESLPVWVISPMPEAPPRQHKHERQYTPSTHSVIPTRRIWNGDYDGQMIFGDLGGLKFPGICLTGEEKPYSGNLSQPGIEPGLAVWQARMLSLAPLRWTNSLINTVLCVSQVFDREKAFWKKTILNKIIKVSCIRSCELLQ